METWKERVCGISKCDGLAVLADIYLVQNDCRLLRGGYSCHDFNATLVFEFPLSKELGCVAATVLELIDLSVASVANEHQVIDVVEAGRGDCLAGAWATAAERVNVRTLGAVHSLLRYDRLPKFRIASPKLTATGGTPPEHCGHLRFDVPSYVLSGFVLSRRLIIPAVRLVSSFGHCTSLIEHSVFVMANIHVRYGVVNYSERLRLFWLTYLVDLDT